MPKKNTKTANTTKRRTKVKNLDAARNLDKAEAKTVRGGIIAVRPEQVMGDGSVRPALPSITDGTSNTILVGERR